MRLGPTVRQAMHISHSAKAHATINIVPRHIQMYPAVPRMVQSSQDTSCQLLAVESDINWIMLRHTDGVWS